MNRQARRAMRKWQRLKKSQERGVLEAYRETEQQLPPDSRKMMDVFWRCTAEMFQQSGHLPGMSWEDQAIVGSVKEMTTDEIVESLKNLHAVGALTVIADDKGMRLALSFPDGTIVS